MLLTQQQTIQTLQAAGVYRPSWSVVDTSYTTLDRHQVVNVYWPAWVESLPPELVERVQIGGGKTIARPLWIANVFDCDDHTADFAVYVRRCCAAYAAKNLMQRGGTPLGSMSYIAVPKPGNRREGGHDAVVFIDHDGRVNWFEPADGSLIDPLPIEVASVWEGDLR